VSASVNRELQRLLVQAALAMASAACAAMASASRISWGLKESTRGRLEVHHAEDPALCAQGDGEEGADGPGLGL